ncbi:hypothetical protein LTR17_014918 [Elasticomyces elasticus]|nr:hypothetical protein LTR17_014918 [Elasticomyces elasticus]
MESSAEQDNGALLRKDSISQRQAGQLPNFLVDIYHCSATTAARVLARMAESSRDTYEITTDVTNTYVLQVLHAIVKRVLSSGHSMSDVAIRLRDALEQKITADETDWACDTDPHDRILRLFSAFASISHWTQSQFLGSVMRVFFVDNVRTLLSRDTAENVRWASCIEYSWMRPDDKLECLRMIARVDPESVELVRGNAGSRRRGMDRDQHSAWDDNMIFNDRMGRLRGRGRHELDWEDISPVRSLSRLRGRGTGRDTLDWHDISPIRSLSPGMRRSWRESDRWGRSRSAVGPRTPRMIEERVDSIVDTAERLREESRELLRDVR